MYFVFLLDFHSPLSVFVQSSTSGFSSTSKPLGLSQRGEKKRVAHQPKPVTASPASKTKTTSAKAENKTTLAITASKTEKRVAHTPNLVRR